MKILRRIYNHNDNENIITEMQKCLMLTSWMGFWMNQLYTILFVLHGIGNQKRSFGKFKHSVMIPILIITTFINYQLLTVINVGKHEYIILHIGHTHPEKLENIITTRLVQPQYYNFLASKHVYDDGIVRYRSSNFSRGN